MTIPNALVLRRTLLIYRAAAISMIVLVALTSYLAFSGGDRWLYEQSRTSAWAAWALGILFSAIAATIVALWYAGIRYTLLTRELVLPRAAAIAMAIVGGPLFAFFYYWLAVHWRSETRRFLGPAGMRAAA